ncbi:MAG TPA: hypothetical protein VGJ15_10780 [Pirellulales bacterium]
MKKPHPYRRSSHGAQELEKVSGTVCRQFAMIRFLTPFLRPEKMRDCKQKNGLTDDLKKLGEEIQKRADKLPKKPKP